MMGVTSRFVPFAPLTLISVMPDNRLRPCVAGLINSLAVFNGVGFAFIPSGFLLRSLRPDFTSQATTRGRAAVLADEICGHNFNRFPAVAFTPPIGMVV
jgi:hypothetical protein